MFPSKVLFKIYVLKVSFLLLSFLQRSSLVERFIYLTGGLMGLSVS